MALSFALLGYRTVAFNTSGTDLRGLDLPDSAKYHLSFKGSDGVGRNRDRGAELLRANAPKIIETVHKALGNCDHLVICGGLAGGTGSNVGKLAGTLREFRKPITIMGTLPLSSEGTVDKFNAILAISEISRSPAHNFVLVDNTKISLRFPDASLENHFRYANNFVAGGFDHLNRISVDTYYDPVYTFDGEDFRKVITGRGTMLWGMTDRMDTISHSDRKKTILQVLRSYNLWPDGYNYASAQRAALVLSAAPSQLKTLSADFWRELVSSLSELTSGCGCYYGLFKAPEGVKPQLTVWLSGLDYPDYIKEMMDDSRMEAQMLSRKLEQDLTIPEAGVLDSYSLFEDAPEEPSIEAPVELAIEADIFEPEAEESVEVEGAEFRPMAVETEIASPEEIPAADIPTLAPEEIEAIIQKRSGPKHYILTAAILIIIVGILGGMKLGLFQQSQPDPIENQTLSVPQDIMKIPAGLVLVQPSYKKFYLIFNKKDGRLELFNSQGKLIRSYFCTAGKPSSEKVPQGIYYPLSVLKGDNLPNDFYPMAYRLSYPGPMDHEEGYEREEIFIGGYPGKTSAEMDGKGSIVLEAADMVELSSFITLHRTPVIVFSKSTLTDLTARDALTAEITNFINTWAEAWSKQDWDSYIEFFSGEFIPRSGNLEDWFQTKRIAFRNAKTIDVKIDKLEILRAETYIVAEFEQDFSTDGYSDFGIKRLYIIKEHGEWKIKADDWFEI